MTCKIVPDMTYNVFGGTLNLALSILHDSGKMFGNCNLPLTKRKLRLKRTTGWAVDATQYSVIEDWRPQVLRGNRLGLVWATLQCLWLWCLLNMDRCLLEVLLY